MAKLYQPTFYQQTAPADSQDSVSACDFPPPPSEVITTCVPHGNDVIRISAQHINDVISISGRINNDVSHNRTFHPEGDVADTTKNVINIGAETKTMDQLSVCEEPELDWRLVR